MNLKERLALRKVATYRINWIERKYLKRRMDACSTILTRVETKVDNISGILDKVITTCAVFATDALDAELFG